MSRMDSLEGRSAPVRRGMLLLMGAVALTTAGCITTGAKTSDASATTATTPAGAAKVGPGMTANGDVTDPTKVEAGFGQKVKGQGNWEGEITGKPAPGSKLTKLQIGMSMKQVTDIAGQPTDQGAYMTAKAWIPFYFGSDKHRYEMTYKGQGRLVFAGGGMGDMAGGHLIWVIHSANETGYR